MVAFGVAYVVAALLFVPAAAMTIGAGALFGPRRALPLVWSAAMATAAAAFLIARHFARPRVEALARRQPRFAAFDAAIGARGGFGVFLLRLSPLIPFDLSNYLFGLTSVGLGPYLAASGVGMLPGALLYVGIGHVGAEGIGGRRRSPLEWVLLGVGLAATLVVMIWLGRAARAAARRGGT